MERVAELMRSYWRLCEPTEPGIVISVVGSSRSLAFTDRRRRSAFHRGIIKVRQPSGACRLGESELLWRI